MGGPVLRAPPTFDTNSILTNAVRLIITQRARRDRAAANFISSLPPGTTFGDIAADKDKAKQFERYGNVPATSFDPNEVFVQHTPGSAISAVLERVGLRGREDVGASLLAGQPTTVEGAAASRKAGEVRAGRQLLTERGAAGELRRLEAEEPKKFREFSLAQTTASDPEVVAATRMDAVLSQISTAAAMATFEDDELNAALAQINPSLNVPNVVGATKLGFGGLLGILGQIAVAGQQGQAALAQDYERARIRTWEKIAKEMNVDVEFVRRYFEAPETLTGTIAGASPEEFIRGMDHITQSAMAATITDNTLRGDPKIREFQDFMVPLLKQLQDNPEVLGEMGGLVQSLMDNAFANFGGIDRATGGNFAGRRNWFQGLINFVAGSILQLGQPIQGRIGIEPSDTGAVPLGPPINVQPSASGAPSGLPGLTADEAAELGNIADIIRSQAGLPPISPR